MVLKHFLLLSTNEQAISPIKRLIEVLLKFGNNSAAALVDSGATNNFISRANAKKFNLKIVPSDGIIVRLADGQTVQTESFAIAEVQLGELSTSLRFEILNEDVAIIIGMPFLEVANPHINWKQKTIKIKHKGRLIPIPTPATNRYQQPGSPVGSVISKNSFAELVDDNNNNNSDDDLIDVATTNPDKLQPASNSSSLVSKLSQCASKQQVDRKQQPKFEHNSNSGAINRAKLNHQLNQCDTLQQMLYVCTSFDDTNHPPLHSHTANNEQQLNAACAKPKIEQVSLHTFMRGMRKQQYLNSFVMVNNDVNQGITSAQESCFSASVVTPNIDTSLVNHTTLEQCKLVGGVQSAVRALQYARTHNIPVAQLYCPHCNFPVLDTQSTHTMQKGIHVCKNAACAREFRNNTKAFGNPLAAYKINNNSLVHNPKAKINFIHRHAHGEQGQSDKTTLSELANNTMKMLKATFGSVFKEPTYPINRSQHRQHQIKLVDPSAPPPKRRLYPLSEAELKELKEQIQLFLSTNRITPSSSPYGAPILFARKKDGRLRMCIDYRALNSQTVPDSFPLPRIDELLARIQGARYFSKLDLRDGYHQVPVSDESRPLTAFTCRYGTFEWLVMPFGLCNAPGTFQRIMNDVFFPLLDRGVQVYLDDILIYSRTEQEHVALLKEVFNLLQQNQLFIKEEKCALFLEQVEFLGHVISAQGVSVEQGKTEAVKNWPVPTCVNEVQQFMGLANYYRKFMFKFSDIAQPLTSLTRKNVLFNWTQKQQQAFDEIKRLLCNSPVLKVFDGKLPTRLICDASDFAIGSVLEQQHSTGAWHPVEFMSKSLNQAERNYSATDREFVAIRYSLEKWQHLLVNREFVIYTDHAALTYLQSSSHVSRRNARWLEFLSQFQFKMLHIRGDSNVADHLSRITPASAAQLASFISVFDTSALMDAIKAAQRVCNEAWFVKLKSRAGKDTKVQLRNDLLCILVDDYFCPVVPREANITGQILRDLHASALGGHLGFLKLYNIVRRRFYWQHMRRDIDLFCRRCVVCQQNKVSTQRPAGLLQPLPVAESCFESISMDFVTHLPESRGFDAIFSIVDRFSKLVKFVPIKQNYDAEQIATLLFENWICQYGMPQTIVSDRDPKFTSKFWQCLTKLLSCKTAMSTAYHPQSDGQTERFHRSIEQVLRCFCTEQNQWVDVLQQCSFALNSSIHQATSHSPFYTVFLRNPRLPIDAALARVRQQPVEAVEKLVERRHAVDKAVKNHIERANRYSSDYANRRRRHLEFDVDDLVMLSTANLPLPPPLSRKLAPRWLGPLRVLARIGTVAYRLALPPSLTRLHDVFHVSLLKKFDGTAPAPRPPVFACGDDEEFEIQKIISHRSSRRGHQYLILWKGYPAHESTWEPEQNLEHAQELLASYKSKHGLE